MGGEVKTRLYDPNGELSEDDIADVGMMLGAPFRRCRITPQWLDGFPPTVVYGEMGKRKHVVYVRVTHDAAEEVGTGPMPLILIDAANQLGAEPHVMRINLTVAGNGVAFHHNGVDEIEAELKADIEGWNAILLRGKSMADYLRLVKGKVSRMEVVLDLSRIDKGAPDDEVGEGGVLLYGLNTVPQLMVDDRPLPLVAINVAELLRSTKSSDQHWILTCDCGVPECGGIDHGVDVIHDQGLVLWRGYGLRPRRIFIFDRVQYRDAILKGAREFIELYRKHRGEHFSAYFVRFSRLERALYEAEE